MFKYEIENIKSVILWQYENSEKYKALISIIDDIYKEKHIRFWENWYRDVFNIDTANDFGLSIWAKILQIPSDISFDIKTDDKVAFGFNNERHNFGTPEKKSNFGNNKNGLISTALTQEQKRIIIKCRYFQLTYKPTLDNINNFLKQNLWKDDNRVYVIDNFNMQWITYTFFYQPDHFLEFLLNYANILPRPAGVGVKIRIIQKVAFGFSKNRNNFGTPSKKSNFAVEEIIRT